MRRCSTILYIPPDSLCISFSQTHSANSIHFAISESSSSSSSLKFLIINPPTNSMAELLFPSLFAPTRQEQGQPCALNHADNRGIDLGLRLCSIDYDPWINDPWIIKKNLTVSDLGNLCRLLVPKGLTQKHVLPFMNKTLNDISTGETVTVYDNDMNTKHELVFKYLQSAKCCVLQANWKKEFVNVRKLKEGDLIGLYWDARRSIFVFSVLKRADMKSDTPVGY